MRQRRGVESMFSTAELFLRSGRGEEGTRAFAALNSMNAYVEAAVKENKLIWKLLGKLTRLDPHKASDTLKQAFIHIHFYFICWHRIEQMFQELIRSSRCNCVKPIFNPYARQFAHYNNGRDYLEHFIDRLPGRQRLLQMRAPMDLGNILGKYFTFGGERWDISPSSAKSLQQIVKRLNKELRRELLARQSQRSRKTASGKGRFN